MSSNRTQQLAYTGLMTTLIFISTRFISIPIPRGYIHFGDAMIFVSAILLNWRYAAFASGFGSALADLSFGYFNYSLPTLIIKAIMSIIVSFAYKNKDSKVFASFGLILSGLWLVVNVALRAILSNTISDPSVLIEDLSQRGIDTASKVLSFSQMIQTALLVCAIVFPILILVILLKSAKGTNVTSILKQLIGFSMAGMWMVIGYYITEYFFYGPILPIFNIPFNVLQFLVGVVIAIIILLALPKELKVKFK